MTVFVAVMFGLAVAELSVFDLSSDDIFLGVGIIGAETAVFLSLLGMVLNSCWTGFQLSRNTNLMKETPLHESETVPLRYAE